MIPRELQHLGDDDAGRAWLEALPRLVEECAERWGLRLGGPAGQGHASLTLAASLPDGTDAVLKVQFPHRECEHEAAALALWDGDGAVRLLDHDPGRNALLLERCSPGTSLSELPAGEALDVLAGLLPRLWRPAGRPFLSLEEEAATWEAELESARTSRRFEPRLLDTALDALRTLRGSQGEQVLLHQDIHGGNVLRAQREQWLAIDPKPLVGERELGVAPLVRSRELGHSRRAAVRRLDRLSADLGLDRERARLWTIAQSVAWSGEGFFVSHLETAQWLLDA